MTPTVFTGDSNLKILAGVPYVIGLMIETCRVVTPVRVLNQLTKLQGRKRKGEKSVSKKKESPRVEEIVLDARKSLERSNESGGERKYQLRGTNEKGEDSGELMHTETMEVAMWMFLNGPWWKLSYTDGKGKRVRLVKEADGRIAVTYPDEWPKKKP